MSKWFVDSREVDRIHLEDGQWVDIKRRLSIGDMERLEAVVLGVEFGKGAEVTGTLKPFRTALLQIAIVDWSFTDANGQKLPINRDTIGQMSMELAERLLDEINKRNPFAQRGI